MDRFKSIFASKTILTAVVGAIFALLSAFGVLDVGVETQGLIVTALFTIAGFFRFQATQQLAIGKPGPGL